MTYFDNWNEFLHEARLLYFRTPLKTKYVFKYIKGKGKITLKVTDNKQCCKFRVDPESSSRLINQFNALFLNWSVSKDLSSAEYLPLKITPSKPKPKQKRLGRRRV
ncbi:Signal recognition particle 9 kDa protein (SRP9) family protein [Theileria parva strain Muguga]|uniref:Signal recognition particle, putative n=1 Tax=Theileria parva TaxID=5875 RepID=Q4N7J3_THEPA|nr:Signal recognition particle 9 kDa protein (SRP9) family protein [Theileria parva strain Muguga]EAN34065.1 Signal recognition particle 9 kDa protein (SRP9) family protein [Theileria parva strain Muguga]|eukprot:XP_766348.1 signal recognition particle [Theileria parva strain Muguga]